MQIAIKYHDPEMQHLGSIGIGDWIDLRSAENVVLHTGEFHYLSLGVSMKLPEGYEAHVAPRSSSFAKWGFLMVNSVGVVDNSYSGTNDIWKIPIYATRDTEIHKNDRVCQFRIIQRMPPVEFVEVDELDAQDRGGFGSTGTN